MAKAGAGAYSQLQRVGNYVAPQINKAADRLNQQGMQQKQLKAEASARKEARDETWRLDTQTDFSNFELEATGNAGRDDMFKLAAEKGIQRAESYFRQARELRATDPNKADIMKAKGRSIQTSFKNLSADSAIVKAMFDGYAEAYANGKIKEGAYRSFMNGLSRNEAVPYLDDNDQWRVRVMVRDETSGEILKDENGEVKYEDKSLSEIKKGLDKPYDFNEVHGQTGELNKVLTAMGKNKWDEINGQFIDTKQEFGAEQEKSLNDFIEGTLGSDREMYKWYYYATGEEKLKGFNTADKDKITNYINTAVKGAYGKEVTRKVTPTTQEEKEEAARKLAAARVKAAGVLAEAVDDRFTKTNKRLTDEAVAKNLAAKNKKGTKEVVRAEKSKMYYDLAYKLREVDSEEDAQKILDDSGYSINVNDDFWNWWDKWDSKAGEALNVGTTDETSEVTINVSDTHKMAAQFAKIVEGFGFNYDDKFSDNVTEEEVAADKGEKPTPDKPTPDKPTPEKLTPEEAKAKAQALIDKYSEDK